MIQFMRFGQIRFSLGPIQRLEGKVGERETRCKGNENEKLGRCNGIFPIVF